MRKVRNGFGFTVGALANAALARISFVGVSLGADVRAGRGPQKLHFAVEPALPPPPRVES